jgi:hypothetical protein
LIPEENGYDVVPIDTVIERHSHDPNILDSDVKFVLALDEKLEVKNLQVITKAGVEYERHNAKWIKRPVPYFGGEDADYEGELSPMERYTFIPCQWFIMPAYDHEKLAGRTMKVIAGRDISEPLNWQIRDEAILLNPIVHSGQAANEESVPWLKFAPKVEGWKYRMDMAPCQYRAILSDKNFDVLALLAVLTNDKGQIEYFERVNGKWYQLPREHYLRGDLNYVDVLELIVPIYDFERDGGRIFAANLVTAHLPHMVLEEENYHSEEYKKSNEIQMFGPGGGYFSPSEVPSFITSENESTIITNEGTRLYEYDGPLNSLNSSTIFGVRDRCKFYEQAINQGEFDPIFHSLYTKKGTTVTEFVNMLVATHVSSSFDVRY